MDSSLDDILFIKVFQSNLLSNNENEGTSNIKNQNQLNFDSVFVSAVHVGKARSWRIVWEGGGYYTFVGDLNVALSKVKEHKEPYEKQFIVQEFIQAKSLILSKYKKENVCHQSRF